MKNRYFVASAALVLLAALATLLLEPNLPARVPVHWNAAGVVDGYGPRWILWLVGPGLMLSLLALFAALPSLSPRRFQMGAFLPTYRYFMLVTVTFMGYAYAVMLGATLSGAVRVERALPAGICVLTILLGNPMGKVTPNFFVGIRTPWTLASSKVWYATHRLSARLMVASGLLGLLAVLLHAPFGLVIVLSTAWAGVAILYSLLCYKRLERAGQLDTRETTV
jgi:uncharacterized membrane protein